MPDSATQCLDAVAREATRRLKQSVIRLAPRDKAPTWNAGAMHPLAALDTAYQGIVRDALRYENDPERRYKIQRESLGDFFFADDAEPRLFGVPRGGAYLGDRFPLLADKVRGARDELDKARRVMEAGGAGEPWAERTRKHLQAASDLAARMYGAFFRLMSVETLPPSLLMAKEDLAGLPPIGSAGPALFPGIRDRLAAAVEHLADAIAGVASVQMDYTIESFYLFRLLVRYRVESERELTNADIAKASGTLTDLVTNVDPIGDPWLFEWLQQKTIELAGIVTAADGTGNTLFFLKGGRAVQYLLTTPRAGRNDWDTQIVINPWLPAAEWYAVFQRVANSVLLALDDFKLEYYRLLYGNAARFEKHLAAVASPPLDPPLNPLALAHAADCKAELIDVGLPRYQSIEAREQWMRMKGSLLKPSGVSIPGYAYYIDEIVLMVREVFADVSLTVRKAPARVKRLHDILKPKAVDAVIAGERDHIPPDLLREVLSYIDGLKQRSPQFVLTVLLRQFVEAYGFDREPDLAERFDAFFARRLAEYPHPAYPAGLKRAIEEDKTWTEDDAQITDAIGQGQAMSELMEAHFEARERLIPEHRKMLGNFIRRVAMPFDQKDELELQLAVRGSFAAHLHADYNRYHRMNDLDPVTFISLVLYSPAPGRKRPSFIPDFVLEAVRHNLPDALSLDEVDPEPTVLRIRWRQEKSIPPFTYRPLAIEIVLHAGPERPLLAYVWGMPVLSLPDLIREYRQSAAAIDEFGRRSRLRATADALVEILTRAADPEPPNTALAMLASGRAHSKLMLAAAWPEAAPDPGRYLMISGAGNAVARRGTYPRVYHHPRDAAFEVTLTDNRPALRAQLTVADAPPIKEPDPAPDQLPQQIDRTLDLLVINHGKGRLGSFADWSAEDIRENLVAPLVAANARANIIVLDFDLSASLLGAFEPLCAPDGFILSSLYGAGSALVTTGLWASIQKALAKGDLGTLENALCARAGAIAAGLTGEAHLHRVRTMPEAVIADYLQANPGDRDPLSIARYLPDVAAALRDPDRGLAEVHAGLLAVKARSSLGFTEQEMLATVPGARTAFTEKMRTAFTEALADRVTAILTEKSYGLQLDVGKLPLFDDGPCLWALVKQHRGRILARAQGLTRCPAPFALWNQQSRALTLDAALTSEPLAGEVRDQIERVAPGQSGDVPAIIDRLKRHQTISILNQVSNYLQEI